MLILSESVFTGGKTMSPLYPHSRRAREGTCVGASRRRPAPLRSAGPADRRDSSGRSCPHQSPKAPNQRRRTAPANQSTKSAPTHRPSQPTHRISALTREMSADAPPRRPPDSTGHPASPPNRSEPTQPRSSPIQTDRTDPETAASQTHRTEPDRPHRARPSSSGIPAIPTPIST